MLTAVRQSELLKNFELFSNLDSDTLDLISQQTEYVYLKRYHVLYKRGEKARKIFFMIDGMIKLYRRSDTGRELIKSIQQANGMLGEEILAGFNKRQETAIALNQDVHLLSINGNFLRSCMLKCPDLAINHIGIIGKNMRQYEDRLTSFVLDDARSRIVNFLRNNAAKYGRKVGLETLINHGLTHQDIADYTGTSRQTVTSVLNELKKENKIYFNRGKILIRDMHALL